MGTNCAIYLANFYLFAYEFDFLKCLFKNNACPAVLQRLYLLCRIVDDLFVADFPDFENFIYLDQDSFDGGIYPNISWELKYTSKSFSRNFLDLAMKQRYILWYLWQMLSTRVCNCWNDFHALSIPISQLLLSWELSIVNFTGSWGFVVVKSSKVYLLQINPMFLACELYANNINYLLRNLRDQDNLCEHNAARKFHILHERFNRNTPRFFSDGQSYCSPEKWTLPCKDYVKED